MRARISRGGCCAPCKQAIDDSDPELAQYFFVELKRHRPEALRYFTKPAF
ncbi:hypothetical protein [Methanoculleus chikugoensis]